MYRHISTFLGAGLILALTSPQVSAHGLVLGGDALMPHRAAYTLSLASKFKPSAPSHIEGVMAYSFRDVCDGWAVENRLKMELTYEQGRTITLDWHYTSWEAKDGRRFRFAVEQKHNDALTEKFDGVAQLEGPAGKAGGWALFSGKEEREVTLPTGTLFPTSHLLAGLKAAETDKTFFSLPLFDGGGEDNPYATTVFVSDGSETKIELSPFKGVKIDVPSYAFRMAFFPLASIDQLPAFEMDITYRADGIASRILQEFGDFGLEMIPSALEPLPPVGC